MTATFTNNDTNPCQGICSHDSTTLGFDTTPDGTKHLGVVPLYQSPNDASVTFSFAQPVDAFGAYLTGTDSTVVPGSSAGTIWLQFNDGTAHSIQITENTGSGGVLFYGFTSFGASILSITYHEAGSFASGRDIFGVDDVVYHQVPESATWLLLGSGLAGLAAWRRRRRP